MLDKNSDAYRKNSERIIDLNKSRTGIKLSETHRKNISQNAIRGPRPSDVIAKISASLKGRKFSKTHCENILKAQIGKPKPHVCGEKHGLWNGGSRKYSFEYCVKRGHVLRKDEKCCLICLTKEKLTVHHIDHNKFNNSFNNLITLCHKCNLHANRKNINSVWQPLFTWYVLCRNINFGLLDSKYDSAELAHHDEAIYNQIKKKQRIKNKTNM